MGAILYLFWDGFSGVVEVLPPAHGIITLGARYGGVVKITPRYWGTVQVEPQSAGQVESN